MLSLLALALLPAHASPGLSDAPARIPELAGLPSPDGPPAATLDATPSAEVQAWLDERDGSWIATVDPRTGTAHRLAGPGLELGSAARTAGAATARAWELIELWPELWGVPTSDLEVALVREVGDTWVVVFDRTLHGVRIEDASVELRLQGSRLVLIGVDTRPHVTADTRPAFDGFEAGDMLLDALPYRVVVEQGLDDPELVVVPVEGDAVLAWRFEIRTSGEVDWAQAYVDAHTGDLVAWRSMLAEGRVTGDVDDRFAGNGTAPWSLPYLQVDGGYTGPDGSLAADTDATVRLTGRYADVTSYSGNSWSTLLEARPDAHLVPPPAHQAELDAFAYVGAVSRRARNITATNSWASGQVATHVNISSTCNAYFDGSSINFFAAGGGCANTARLADVVYHEFGHGFHAYAIVGGSFDGSMSEGASDYLSATITGDPGVGPGFFQGSSGYLREIETDRVYPDDWYGEVHYDGLIYAGAMWDLRKALIARHGEGPGVRIADVLFYATLQGSDRMTDAYLEALLAADDDGDLTNGVPDGCLIEQAFAAHGLAEGPSVVDALTLDHRPLESGPLSDSGYPLEVTVDRGACGGPSVSDVTAFVETVEGTSEVTLTGSGSAWSGSLPGTSTDGVIRYHLEATAGSSTARLPAQGQFQLYAGDMVEVVCEDFESGFGDFTHGAESLDPQVPAVDEWETGAPRGLGGDPTEAFSGTAVAGLDLGTAGDADGYYEPDLLTWLESPAWDVSAHPEARLQVWTWVSVEEARYDRARVLVNGTEVWTHADSGHHDDDAWRMLDVPLEGADTAQLRVEVETDPALQRGGVAVDRVCVVAPPPPEDGENPEGGGSDDPDGSADCGDIDFTDRNGDCEPDPERAGASGCGCSTGATWPTWMPWLALTLLALRRRE